MKLMKLGARGVRGVPDGTYSFEEKGLPRPVTYVTGGLASGKTMLLRAIAAAKEAIGPYGLPPSREAVALRKDGLLETTWWLNEAERRIAGVDGDRVTVSWDLARPCPADVPPGVADLFARMEIGDAWPKVELFPASRTLEGRPEPAELARTRRLSAEGDRYASAVAAVGEAAFERATRIAARVDGAGVVFGDQLPDPHAPVKRSIAMMLPHLRLARVEPVRTGQPRIVLVDRAGREREASELSGGETNALLFALAFPWLGLDGGLVLVDTPEMGLPPDEQLGLVRSLGLLADGAQLIVATTSPGVLARAEPDAVIDLGGWPS